MPCLFFTMFNYSVDPILDEILNRCLDSGIESVKTDMYFMYIKFNNGIDSKLWNVNKYHAWISEGFIGDYRFSNIRPKRKTMKRLDKELINYFSKNT